MNAGDLRPDEAAAVIESLRNGQPPKRFVSSYSVGMDRFVDDVREEHLDGATMFGRIRFVSGTWGSGKTHFLRLLREAAFDAKHLVASVELDKDEAPLNKFERVFFRISQSVTSPEMYVDNDLERVDPVGEVLRRGLFTSVGEEPTGQAVVSQPGLRTAQEALYAASNLDADFRRIVDGYWRTFSADAGDSIELEERRALALSWFKGEGRLPPYRAAFGVQKIVDRTNARTMLQSISRLARHLGYEGLVLLLDEGELSTSMLRRSDVRAAHNNLRHLIDSIQDNSGLFAVYAATPDFFLNADYGIVTYGALAQRVGRPPDGAPAAYERVWNLDGVQLAEDHYLDAASRIREIFVRARPAAAASVLNDDAIRRHTAGLVKLHPERSSVSTWRVVTQGVVDALDASARGSFTDSAEQAYRRVRSRIGE
jgi:hypothetical protein